MFVVIPTGRTYTATVRSEVPRRCTCEACKTDFTYTLTLTGTGSASSPLWLRNQGASEDAQKAAVRSVEERAKTAFPPIACPTCGHFQSQMVAYYRQERFRAPFKWAIFSLAAVAIVAIIFVNFVGLAELVSSKVFWGALAVPAALLGWAFYLRKHAVPRKK